MLHSKHTEKESGGKRREGDACGKEGCTPGAVLENPVKTDEYMEGKPEERCIGAANILC